MGALPVEYTANLKMCYNELRTLSQLANSCNLWLSQNNRALHELHGNIDMLVLIGFVTLTATDH